MARTFIKKKYKMEFFFPFLIKNAYFCTSKFIFINKKQTDYGKECIADCKSRLSA